MEEKRLTDPDVEFSEAYLEQESGEFYPVLSELLQTVQSDAFGFNPEWRYYKDGKAWLCKITHKKKTVAWLSVWQHYFMIGFYFTEKTGAGIEGLDIQETLKENYRSEKPIGRLKPVVAKITKHEHLDDVYTLMRYKAGLK